MKKILYFFLVNIFLINYAWGQCNPLSVTCKAAQNPVCLGECDSLGVTVSNGTPPYNYSWTGPGSFYPCIDTKTIGVGTFNYSVTVTDINGCTGSCSFSLTVKPNQAVANAGQDQTICLGQAVQ